MMEVLFEFIRQKNAVKITAIDTKTKLEAVVVAPLGMSEKQMQQLAIEKLNYILREKSNKDCG